MPADVTWAVLGQSVGGLGRGSLDTSHLTSGNPDKFQESTGELMVIASTGNLFST